MDRATLDACHGDPKNWRLGMFYVCRADPRIIVPKRLKGLGWTVNFGRPAAVPLMLAVLALAWGAIFIARHAGVGPDGILYLKLGLVIGIIVLCQKMAGAGSA